MEYFWFIWLFLLIIIINLFLVDILPWESFFKYGIFLMHLEYDWPGQYS